MRELTLTALAQVPVEEAVVQAAASIEIPDRYELKYAICESQVEVVRRAIAAFCVLDPNCARRPDHTYVIRSLYLDTPGRDLYRISRERRARRWKARVRQYEGSDQVFLEIKNKDHDLVKKQRARIPVEGWLDRLHACLPADDANAAEHNFRQRLDRYGLVPTVLVRYQREAWLSTVDSYARVTFDRRVVSQEWPHWSFEGDDGNWLALDDARSMLGVPRGVILELKCLTAIPDWLSTLVHEVGLVKGRYSKYCKAVDRHFAHDDLLGMLNQT